MTGIFSYGCGRILPDAIVCETPALPEERPRLIFIDADAEGGIELAYEAVRKRVAVALRGVGDANLHKVLKLSAACRRNGVPAVMLGSWRYIPAVAAAKELVDSGCLGRLTSMRSSSAFGDFSLFCLRDIAAWLGCGLEEGVLEASRDVALEITGENGWLKVDFSLDGQSAECRICLGGHERRRIVPAAEPAVSELAVLGMSLPLEGKIKRLPLMMTV